MSTYGGGSRREGREEREIPCGKSQRKNNKKLSLLSRIFGWLRGWRREGREKMQIPGEVEKSRRDKERGRDDSSIASRGGRLV